MKDGLLSTVILSQNMLEDVTLKDTKVAIKVILRIQTDSGKKRPQETIIDGEDYEEHKVEKAYHLSVEDAARI
jgi:hypothetical protein